VHDMTPGQRWISDTEINLGLGTLSAVEHRTVTVVFFATGETRTYAKQTAPLTRVRFALGDNIHNQQNESLLVESVSDQDGLLMYEGKDANGNSHVWPESQLDHAIQLSRPSERLFAGQIDASKWFELRYQTVKHTHKLAHSDLFGLTGVRTSLIPHQLYIAHEVAKRYAPRVLLADEVGLGKTIEAGLILHQQLLTERARRILIIVPETLIHQWLVEMLRRFNLYFSVFDEERCLALEESAEQDNPFHTEQLILCSQGFLSDNPLRTQQVLAGEWDLLVVDEAHHLQWSPTDSSREYQIIEALSKVTKGVLLLTATPEQLGKESHFARLRLLDPDRFPSYEAFIEEEAHYRPIAEAVEELLQSLTTEDDISDATLATLRKVLVESDSPDNAELINTLADGKDRDAGNAIKQKLIDALLDRHGTGRVLFRNTRAAVKGFPERHVNAYPLPLPASYAQAYEHYIALNQPITVPKAKALLSPDTLPTVSDDAAHWSSFDPRIEWLQETIKSLKPEKILVIAANSSTAKGIAQALKDRTGLHAPVFHEQLSIIERDRAAAHFADMESGGQVLICSEIGSEGRNFQFAHHLVLFDLPLNPDLLEQRIGRLDRIGQKENIQIHVPYFTDSPQSVMFNWYHHGLGAFEQTCPVGPNVFSQLEEELFAVLPSVGGLQGEVQGEVQDGQSFIAKTKQLADNLNESLHKGRDVLLEYNSCPPGSAGELHQRAQDADDSHELPTYLDKVFDCFGVDTEIHSNNCYIFKPGDHMHSHFPGLEEDGMKVTYHRNLALSNEDMHFITWEHPLATGALDLVLSQETGNTALIAIKHPGLPAGTMYLESVYILEPVAQKTLQSKRYLPPTTIRMVVDQEGKNISKTLGHGVINKAMMVADTTIDTETINTIIRTQTHIIKNMLKHCEEIAKRQKPQLITRAHQQIMNTLMPEIERLRALKAHNPNVRDEEIEYFENQKHAINAALESASIRLDAVRIIIATD